MQHRAEDFFLEIAGAIQLDDDRGDEGAAGRQSRIVPENSGTSLASSGAITGAVVPYSSHTLSELRYLELMR